MLLTLAFDILHVYGLFMTSKHPFHIKSGNLQPGDIYMKDLLSVRVTTCFLLVLTAGLFLMSLPWFNHCKFLLQTTEIIYPYFYIYWLLHLFWITTTCCFYFWTILSKMITFSTSEHLVLSPFVFVLGADSDLLLLLSFLPEFPESTWPIFYICQIYCCS